MAEEADQDAATVLVDGLTDAINTVHLQLYFESRRHSSGGPVQSCQRQGQSAILTFENPADAQKVLAKEQHLLLHVPLSVRRPPPRDPSRVLLQGLKPYIGPEVLQLYVECVTNCEMEEMTLNRGPSGENMLIQFSTPLTEEDFSNLRHKVSRHLLEGLAISVERVPRTAQVLVSKLDPQMKEDLLTLYFESKRSSGGEVQDVTLLKEAGAAVVTFKSWEVADRVLGKSHRLQDCMLQLSAYYDFLHPQGPAATVAPEAELESESTTQVTQSVYIDVMEPWKLKLLRCSPHLAELRETFPGVLAELDDNGVRLSGREMEQCQQVQARIVALLRGAAQTHIPYAVQILDFVQRNDIRAHLEPLLRHTEPSASFAVLDCLLVVTASSLQEVRRAADRLKEALCEFSLPVPEACLHALGSDEWKQLTASLSGCSVRVTEQNSSVQVVCLREYMQENQQALNNFLQHCQQLDTVITMEPALLRHLQLYNHELLAGISEVYLEPLEGEDITGFRLHGGAAMCQIVEELIRDVMNNIGTVPVKLEHPGVTRFLTEQGKKLLEELETQYQCVIRTEPLWWSPPDDEHEFDTPLPQMASNFDRGAADRPDLLVETQRVQMETPSVLDRIKEIVAAVEDEMEGSLDSGTFLELPNSEPASQQDPQVETQSAMSENLYESEQDEMDIYGDPSTIIISESEEEDAAAASAEEVEEVHPGAEDLRAAAAISEVDPDLDQARRLSLALAKESRIDEKAKMHLAIQRSMDSMSQSTEEEDRDLKAALEYSLLSYKEEQKHELGHLYKDYVTDMAVDNLGAALEVSMEDSIRAANVAIVTIYGNDDLQARASLLRQAVKAKLNTETIENNCLRKLPEQYHRYLTYLQRKHAVQITIQGSVATIHGFKEYLLGATSDLAKLITRVLQEEWQKLEEAEISKEVSWVWYDLQGREVPYATKANAYIEHAWRQKQRQLDIIFDNKPYTIDFEKMEEYCIESSQTSRIARREAGLGGAKSESGLAGVGENKVEMVKVDEASDEYRKVVRTFYDALENFHSKIKIEKVEKVLNPLLHSQYQLKKRCMERAGCLEPVERILYHGTSEASAKEICQYGFNRSFSGKNATCYGQGVYFAVQSALSVLDFYSPKNDDGNKCVFVVKTLTGDYTNGTEDMKVPPLKKDSKGPLRYDSLVDDITKPTMFVIFNDTQAYPEYLITCRRN